jgi:hypothetical protein
MHSWDGGLSPTSVVWAVRIPNGSGKVNLDQGTASLHVQNVCVFDAFTVPNSLAGVNRTIPLVLGTIDLLRIEWSGLTTVENANQSANQMRGTFVECATAGPGCGGATIEVVATTPRSPVTLLPNGTTLSSGHGFRFVSDPPKPADTVNHFALIGQEQNGVFY